MKASWTGAVWAGCGAGREESLARVRSAENIGRDQTQTSTAKETLVRVSREGAWEDLHFSGCYKQQRVCMLVGVIE